MRATFLTSAHWQQRARRLTAVLAASHITGAVISHGTGTLEETAWYLHLTVPSTKPIVVVGAQRPGLTVGSDTPLNLADAFRVAAAPDSAGAGVVVVLNQIGRAHG